MSDSPIKLEVKRQSIRTPEELLAHDIYADQRLAPAVAVPQAPIQAAPMPEAPRAPEAFDYTPPPAQEIPDRRTQYAADLKAAQAQSRDREFIANLGQAGQTLVEGVSGVKGGPMFQNMLKDANRPVEEVTERFNLDKALAGMRAADEAANPASQTNRAAQSAFAKAYPDLARAMGAEALSRQPRAALESFAKIGDKSSGNTIKLFEALVKGGRAETQNSADVAKTNNEIAQTPFKQQQAIFDSATKRIGAAKVSEGNSSAQDAIAQRNANRHIIDYTKRTEKLGETIAALEQVERLAPGMTRGVVDEGGEPKDFTGVDWTKVKNAVLRRGVGQQFSEPQQVALRSSVMSLKGQLRYLQAGANLTEYEVKYWDDMFADAIASPPEAQAAVIDMFRQTIYSKLGQMESSYSYVVNNEQPGKWDEFAGSPGARTTRHPIFQGLGANRQPTEAEASPEAAPAAEPEQAAPPLPVKAEVREPGAAAPSSPKLTPITPVAQKAMRTVTSVVSGVRKLIPEDKIAPFLNNKNYRVE